MGLSKIFFLDSPIIYLFSRFWQVVGGENAHIRELPLFVDSEIFHSNRLAFWFGRVAQNGGSSHQAKSNQPQYQGQGIVAYENENAHGSLLLKYT
jgi:hypothetical protein